MASVNKSTEMIKAFVRLSNIWTLNKSLIMLPFIRDLNKLERRLRFLETGIPEEYANTWEFKTIIAAYKKRIKQLNQPK